MATLYELTDEWRQLYDMADDPEMDAESWFDTMEAIEGEIEDKAENYGKLIRSLESDEDALDKEIARLKAKADVIANKVARIRARLKEGMELVGKDKIKAGTFTFAIQKNGGKTPLIIAEDAKAENLPFEFVTYPDPIINGEAVRKALDAGAELEWAHYGERGTHLRIK